MMCNCVYKDKEFMAMSIPVSVLMIHPTFVLDGRTGLKPGFIHDVWTLLAAHYLDP